MPADSAAKPSLALSVKGVTASGAEFRWDSARAERAATGLTFSTRRGTGFAEMSVTLPGRRIDADLWDLNLLDELTVYSDSGDIAYEGRNVGMPRTSPLGITVQGSGWMSHAQDRKFQEIFIDRDLSRWGGGSATLRANSLALPWMYTDPDVASDGTGKPAVVTSVSGTWAVTALPICEAWYFANGVPLGKIYAEWTKGSTINAADANWVWKFVFSPDDVLTTFLGDSGTLTGAGPGTGQFLSATSAAALYAVLRLRYSAAGPTAGVAGAVYPIYWSKLAVYGTHGLTLHGSGPGGVYASDVITNLVSRFCLKLNTGGVQATSWPITHLVYSDPSTPYDAFLDVNRYHLWNLAVWEGKTVTFAPFDLSDYDWEIRVDDPGVKISLQGDTTSDFANGIAVTYTDIDKLTTVRLTPDTNATLKDTNPENPANKHGYPLWTEITLSDPTDAASALQAGVIALAEFNRPKSAGSIDFKGWVRDRQGHWQPGWKVRAGDRVSITSSTSLSDRPRLVQETSWNHDALEGTMSIDTNLPRLQAYFDRTSTDLAASGILQLQA